MEYVWTALVAAVAIAAFGLLASWANRPRSNVPTLEQMREMREIEDFLRTKGGVARLGYHEDRVYISKQPPVVGNDGQPILGTNNFFVSRSGQ